MTANIPHREPPNWSTRQQTLYVGHGNEAADLLRRALKLPEEARAALADSLWAGLDHEIRRRLQEINSDAVKLILWQDVRKSFSTAW